MVATSVRERGFAVAMWALSIVFALFLIGFGGLVIGDLPRVAAPLTIDQFVDQTALKRADAEEQALHRQRDPIEAQLAPANDALNNASNNYNAEKATFDNWIATRSATNQSAQDPEVLARTRKLDELKAIERKAEQARDDLLAKEGEIDRRINAVDARRGELRAAATPAYERAAFVARLKVFSLRLAFVLPLVLVAAFFLVQKNKPRYWPLRRGFVIAALYAFLVELVPYIPDYGGYVYYGAGILLTIAVSHFLIGWMRRYLRERDAADRLAETERKKTIQYDEALKKLAAKTCPNCDRTLASTGEGPADFCVHCGMRLYDHCVTCRSRKFAFFRYCMTCGTPAAGAAEATKV